MRFVRHMGAHVEACSHQETWVLSLTLLFLVITWLKLLGLTNVAVK